MCFDLFLGSFLFLIFCVCDRHTYRWQLDLCKSPNHSFPFEISISRRIDDSHCEKSMVYTYREAIFYIWCLKLVNSKILRSTTTTKYRLIDSNKQNRKKTVRPSDLPKSGSNMQLTKPFDFNFDTRTFQLHVPRQLRSTISHPIRMKVNSMHMLTQTQSSSQFSTTGFIKTHSFE